MANVELAKKALRLEYFTIVYNILEAIAAIGFGIYFGSLALEGFGFDSTIETVAAITLVWRLRYDIKGRSPEKIEQVEKRAVKIVGVTFFALAAYIFFEAVRDLYSQNTPESSLPGIIIASLSIVIMIPLARAKKRLAKAMGSRALAADAVETIVCVYLSVILLVGSALYAAFGWWWVDSVASLGMLYFILREGWEALFEGGCSCHDEA